MWVDTNLDPVRARADLPTDSLSALFNTVCDFSTDDTFNTLLVKY